MNFVNFTLYPSVAVWGPLFFICQLVLYILSAKRTYVSYILANLTASLTIVTSPTILYVLILLKHIKNNSASKIYSSLYIFNLGLLTLSVAQIINFAPILCSFQTYSNCSDLLYWDHVDLYSRPMIMYRPSALFVSTIWLSMYSLLVYMMFERQKPTNKQYFVFILLNAISGSLASVVILILLTFQSKRVVMIWTPFIIFNLISYESFSYNYSYMAILNSLSRSATVTDNLAYGTVLILLLPFRRIRVIVAFCVALAIHPIMQTLFFPMFVYQLIVSAIGTLQFKNGSLYFVKN